MKIERSIVGAGGVLYRWTATGQPQLLLIKKRHGFWSLPKGRVKRNEDERDAALREVEEETGLLAEIDAPIFRLDYTIHVAGRPRHKLVTYYLMHVKSGELRPDPAEQIQFVRWFPIKAALRRVRRPRIRMIVRMARAMLEASGPPSADHA